MINIRAHYQHKISRQLLHAVVFSVEMTHIRVSINYKINSLTITIQLV